MTHWLFACRDEFHLGRSGRAPADGVPCSANVPRPAASSFISLRKAPRQRVRWAEQSLISVAPRACPSAQGIGCSPQRNKGGGRSPGDIRGGEYPVAFAQALDQQHPQQQRTQRATTI